MRGASEQTGGSLPLYNGQGSVTRIHIVRIANRKDGLVVTSSSSSTAVSYPQGSAGFDLGASLLILLFLIGGYIDGWSHNHIAGLESFFSIWHAVLYGGFTLYALYLVVPAVRNRRVGHTWAQALPKGYGIGLAGVVIFAVGGIADMFWHIAFGFESNVDVFTSPPHLLLFAATLCMAAAPIRGFLARNDPDHRSWRVNLPLVIALLAFMLELTFILQPFLLIGTADAAAAMSSTSTYWTSQVTQKQVSWHTLRSTDAGGLHIGESALAPTSSKIQRATRFEVYLDRIGIACVIIFAAVLAGILLYTISLGRVPVGTFTLIVFFDTLGVTIMRDPHMPAAFVAPQILVGLIGGIIADLLYAWFKPTPQKRGALYAFAFLAPTLFYAAYFIALQFVGGTWWSSQLVGGSVLFAGSTGLLLAMFVARAPNYEAKL